MFTLEIYKMDRRTREGQRLVGKYDYDRKDRAAKHFYRAKKENKDWLLCRALRSLNDKSEIEVLVHETLRGKAAAHKREVELRRTLRPELNTDCRGD